jgi:aminoglycoside phosphotransferase family enzyme
MTILEAFIRGNVNGHEGKVPLHVVTAIANVFVFENKVYKLYKNDNQFFNENFNNLSSKEGRFAFTRKDFEWNHKLSPEIYTELKGVELVGGNVMFIEPTDEVEELVVVMNKVDMSDGLLKRLVENQISIEDSYQIGYQLGQRVQKIQKVFDISLYEDFAARYTDLEAWLLSVPEIPKEEAKMYLGYVHDYIESHKEEFESSKGLVGQCLDVHADNAVYTNGVLLPMDTYAPKEAWVHGYKFINIYRLASDIYVFLEKEAFEQTLKGYEESTGEKLPREQDKFLILYAELITWPYQYMMAEKEKWRIDIAEKYRLLLKEVFETR